MSASSPPQKIRILLVEDAVEQALLLRRMLEGMGDVAVTVSQDGNHAAALVRDREFDLVVTDLNLPGIDGFELTRLSKTLHPGLPVLAVTGYTNPAYVDEAYRAGADDVMFKPLEQAELVARVSGLMGREERKRGHAPAVLAIGGMPGDVELGCGGSLLQHLDRGDEVLLVPLALGSDGQGTAVVRKAAEMLGVRIIVTETSVSHADDPREHQMLLERLVREIKPHTVFIPSLGDDEPDRREAHRISRSAVGEVPNLLAYETATTTPRFHPSRFVDVGPQMGRKLEALTPYQSGALARDDLRPTFVQAHARYWGRFAGFGEAEPFEVLRVEGREVA
ncbi:MAG: response regulator [Gemmatimonadetes bacterium]|nr:response regulator [Gemmatimonadota bacterium]